MRGAVWGMIDASYLLAYSTRLSATTCLDLDCAVDFAAPERGGRTIP